MWIEPLGLLHGTEARIAINEGLALPLAGSALAFCLARPFGAASDIEPVGRLSGARRQAADRLGDDLPPWCGLPDSPLVMGILNVTPDSFSDGGDHLDTDMAIAAGERMIAEGADILDIGGESTRPGADPTPVDVEIARVVPVVLALRASGVSISVDTRRADTMAAALVSGATIINDVSGLTHDPAAAPLLARSACGIVLMHMRGTPATMTSLSQYDDVAVDVVRELAERLDHASGAGISRSRLVIDPGIGFAKTGEHAPELLRRLPILRNLGCRILIGVSRKRFIGEITGAAEPKARIPGSLAAALFALSRGASILRVHDVAATVQAVRVWQAMAA